MKASGWTGENYEFILELTSSALHIALSNSRAWAQNRLAAIRVLRLKKEEMNFMPG
jgi:hypothetical protein